MFPTFHYHPDSWTVRIVVNELTARALGRTYRCYRCGLDTDVSLCNRRFTAPANNRPITYRGQSVIGGADNAWRCRLPTHRHLNNHCGWSVHFSVFNWCLFIHLLRPVLRTAAYCTAATNWRLAWGEYMQYIQGWFVLVEISTSCFRFEYSQTKGLDN